VLTGKLVRLRLLEAGDAELHWRWNCDPEATRWMSSGYPVGATSRCPRHSGTGSEMPPLLRGTAEATEGDITILRERVIGAFEEQRAVSHAARTVC
jgi:hypothetical protein